MFPSLIYTHLFISLVTFLTGLYVYTSNQKFSFKNYFVLFYLGLHLLTAITGLLIGEMEVAKFSPFQWLSVLTILSFFLTVFRITKKLYSKAKFPMLGAYFGLCIAFAGALHPDRVAGYRFWTKTLSLSIEQANNYWIVLMIIVTIPCALAIIYYNYIEFQLSKKAYITSK